MSKRKSLPNVEVGYGTSVGNDAFNVGVEAASNAMEQINEHSLSLMLVHVKGTEEISKTLDGITTVTEDSPVFGMTSNSKGEDESHVSAIAIASPFLTASAGIGSNANQDIQEAVKQALSSEELENYFGENRAEYWREIVSVGKSVVGILLCSSDVEVSDLELGNALGMLRDRSDGQIPFTGGRTLNVSGIGARDLVYYDESFSNSIMLIIIETHLRIGIGTADGLTSTNESVIVTKADQREILELDNKPAIHRLTEIGHEDALLGIADNFGNSQNIITIPKSEGTSLQVLSPIAVGTRLTIIKAEPGDVKDAGNIAFRKSLIRGSIDEPVIGIVFSSLFRREALQNTIVDEIQTARETRPNMQVVGFDTDIEIGLTDEGLNRINKRTVSVLTLGELLTYAAEVAMQNKELVSRLQRAETSHRALLDLIPDAVMATDTTLQITHWNAKIEELLGHKKENVMGLNVTRILHPRLRYTLESTTKELREQAEAGFKTFEAEIIRKDNDMIPVEVTVSFNPLQEKYCYVIALHDITEHKTAQDILDRERHAYKTIAEVAIDASTLEELGAKTLGSIANNLGYDIGTLRLYDEEANALQLLASIGLDEEEIEKVLPIGPFEETGYLNTEVAHSKTAIFSHDIDSEEGLSDQREKIDNLGIRSFVIYPLTDSKGELLGILNLGSYTPKIDTTESKAFFEVLAGLFATVLERRITQLALISSEGKMRTVLQSMRDFVFVIDENNNYSEFYSAESESLIEPPDVFLGKHVSDHLPASVASVLLRVIERVRETKETQTLDYSLEVEGELHWYSANVSLHENGRSVVIVSRDITQRKSAEDNLATRFEYEKALADISHILLMKQDLTTESFKDALSILRRVSRTHRVYIFENFYDSEYDLSMRLLSEDTAEGVANEAIIPGQQITAYSSGYARWEKELSNGRIIYGQTSQLPDVERKRLEQLDVKSLLVLPLWVQSQWYGFIGFDDTESEREWTDEDIRLLRTASEIISAYIARVSAEIELRSSLRDLELYSSILRHDFANDVMIIMNQIEAAEILGYSDERKDEIIEATKLSAERMSQVLDIFTAEGKQSRYQVRRLLSAIIDTGKKTHPSMTFELKISNEVGNLYVTGGRLLPMVFSNLLRNVSEYAGEESVVRITADINDQFIVFTISDNGPGVDPSIRDRLFEEGVSTTGGGLGLFLSKRVLEGYSGTIEYIDTKGKGAKFEIKVPKV